MGRAPSLCGVILAAGESTRMGSDKALLAWPPLSAPGAVPRSTFLSASIRALNGYNDMVIVVVGKNESTLAPVIYGEAASLLRNPSPEQGQFSSLQVGLREVLNRGRDAAMVTLVDRPPVKAETFACLCSSFAAVADGVWAVVPAYEGKHGHPIIIGREMIEIFLKAPVTASARDIQHQYEEHMQYVSIDDPLIAWNVDTPQDYETLRSHN